MFTIGKIPKKNLLCMTNEHKVKLLELQGHLHCKAGIMCLNRNELYSKEIAKIRDMLRKALNEEKFLLREDLQAQLVRNVTLPEQHVEIIDRFKRNIEYLRAESLTDADKPKMCPLVPLLMFPPTDVGVRHEIKTGRPSLLVVNKPVDKKRK